MGSTINEEPATDPVVVEEHVDVAVIGGGPTGMLSALLLRQLGLSVSIVDAKLGPLDLGRADALNARTQQYLQVVGEGVLQEMLPQGLKCNTSSTFAQGNWKSRQNKWWVGLEHCLHKNFLMIGQPVVEDILFRRLAAHGTTVHYGELMTDISESEEAVVVTTSKSRKIYARYAVAADGAKSTVRTALGISFKGTKPEMVWAVVDTFIDTDFPSCPEIVTFELNGQSRVSWIPRERGMARFYVLLPQDEEITLEKAQDSIREHVAPHMVNFQKTEWFSTFEIKERIASTFVTQGGKGRILLAGDAAHVHAVNGGQGLNTGIADAFALSWRLATAVKSTESLGPDGALKLIMSYDTERRATAQGVIDVAATLVRDTVHTAKQYVATIEKNAGYITGMGVCYDEFGSELIVESQEGIWVAGKRCPDLLLKRPGQPVEDDATRLYSKVKYGKYVVLDVGGKQACRGNFEEVCTHFTLLPTRNEGTGVVGTKSQDDERTLTSDFVTSSDNFLVVVRPDMYIGYVGSETGWRDYMRRVFLQ